MSAAGARDARVGDRSVRVWGAVLLLMLVGVFNIIDRFLPAVLAEQIKHDLHLSDTAIGLINGFGFLIIYAVVGIPIARLADRGRYGLVISACLALWSTMTMMGGLAQTGWQLALTRMGVAVGEAGSTPAAHAYVARNFPAQRRAAPLAVLMLSVPLAGTAGLIAGGLLGQIFGWRLTFLAMGVISLLLAPVVLLVLGAGRATPTAEVRPGVSLRESLALLKKRSYLFILAGSACIGVAGYTLTTFAPAFLIRVHGLSVGEVGLQYGLASGIIGIAGLLATGWLADRLAARDPRWLLWVVVAMIGILLPFSCTAFLVGDHVAAVIVIALANIIGMAYMAPVVAAIQRLAPVDQRATASAVLLFCTAIIGGAGPLVAGMISDALQPQLGAAALGRALLIVPVMHLVAGLLYLAACRSFSGEMVTDDPAQA